VQLGGYAWWYVDALSDDGQHGIAVIAFIGSVFSPYYAWARRSGNGDPLNHCALNVALYGGSRKLWAMTERGRNSLLRTASSLAIGPSLLAWDGGALTIHIQEITSPVPSRIRGVVRIHPQALMTQTYSLDSARRHRWWPIAPCARVQVMLEKPALCWSGIGYLDTNYGDAPLESAFQSWNWSRASLNRGAAVLYDVAHRNGPGRTLALQFNPSGDVDEFDPPPLARLQPPLWKISRTTRVDSGRSAKVVQTLEDVPFYARSLISTHLLGQPAMAMHESLSLDRFRASWVRAMLPFRMPRAWRR
jgi:carotenoid 1,2-hydratase